jgi:hypothetical protein
MAQCSVCGKPFVPGTPGWMARLEARRPAVRPDSALTTVLLCPEDYAKLRPVQKAGWHEYADRPEAGPTREKRPGQLR